MDSMTKSVVFRGSAPLIVGGKRYEVKALPIAEVVGNDDFQTSGLYFPDAEANEPINNWQGVYLQDERYRQALDRWLRRLLTLDGEPMSLELIAAHGWRDIDIGRFLTTTLQASGLTRKKAEAGKEATTPEQWLDILTELQYIIHTSWHELVGMPLLRLDATRERILKQWTQDIQNRMPRLVNGLAGGGTIEQQPTADPHMGTMPQPKSRDEYFAMMNQYNR